MLNGTFALLDGSLRLDARSWPPHLARPGLMGTIYASLCSMICTCICCHVGVLLRVQALGTK